MSNRPTNLKRSSTNVAALLVILGASQTQAESVLECAMPPIGGQAGGEMCNLGLLAEDSDRNNSFARGISGDGTLVVGTSTNGNVNQAFKWNTDAGMLSLDTPTSLRSGARRSNTDGSVIVGSVDFVAHVWTTNGNFSLGEFFDAGTSTANGVDSSGVTVVGDYYSFSDARRRAFLWTNSGGKIDLGFFPGGNNSDARDVSAAGDVVIGAADDASGNTFAFRWTDVDGMINIGSFWNGSEANAVSADGLVIVGESKTFFNDDRAFRWTEPSTEGGGIEMLGTLSGENSSVAYDTNSDGSVVVGSANITIPGDTSGGDRAFRWTRESGMVNLGTLKDGEASTAFGVSDDGSIVVGQSGARAFIWRGAMEDFENLITSFPVLANDTAVATAEQHFTLGKVMRQTQWTEAGQSIVSTRAEAQRSGHNHITVGARTTSLAALSFGYGINNSLTLGIAMNANDSSLDNNAFNMDAGIGAALWAEYSEHGAARTGVQFSGAVGYMQDDGDVARGRLLTDVIVATGNATVKTRAAQARIGYGISQGDWLVTPSFGLTNYETTRSGYTEVGAAFNASYDELRTSRTEMTLSLTGEFSVTEHGRLSLGVGIEHEVNSKPLRLTGTSDIPGLATFDIDSSFKPNRTRAFVTTGYTHDFGNGSTLSGDLRVGHATYGSTPSVGLGMTYATRF
jgi:probable HAF family extracellular repeat protein